MHDEKASEGLESSKTISFPATILWDILTPINMQSTKGTFQTPDTTYSDHTVDTRLRVRTQYTHPLTDNRATVPPASTDSFAEEIAASGQQLGGLAEVSIDDLFTQFPEHDFFYSGYNQGTM